MTRDREGKQIVKRILMMLFFLENLHTLTACVSIYNIFATLRDTLTFVEKCSNI